MNHLIVVTGTLSHRRARKVRADATLYDWMLTIAPTGRERKAKQLYLATFSVTIDGQMQIAKGDNEPVTLVCEVTGQPGSQEGDGLNRIKPLHVALANLPQVRQLPATAPEAGADTYPLPRRPAELLPQVRGRRAA